MIAIITEKPSVGHQIARVIGAREKCGGYMQGNGYIVTWAFGHLVQLALPEFYGHRRGAELPLIPDPFALVIRTRQTEKKTATDSAASRQLGIIRRVLAQCDSVIAATDAGREGELIFRRIYHHLGCTLPVKRLWISSLTEEAIEHGLNNLKDGAEFDRLYLAADCRAKADWLVGINASNALARATGVPESSLGRVQTPTLAMIASRYLENRGFLPADYWVLSATLHKGGTFRKFYHTEEFRDKAAAEAVENRLRSCKKATVTRVERKTVHEQPPLLYDLTTLQKDCNVLFGITAEQTLNATQSLYEKKLISYPRTGSRYISQDLMPQIPSLLRMIGRMEPFAHFAGRIETWRPAHRSVDGAKVTDHHALIITGNYVRETLTANERRVYDLICGRMLEAFGPRCEKETLLIEATIGDLPFRSRSVETIVPGWRGVYNRPEEPDGEVDNTGAIGIEFTEGETLSVMGHSLAGRKTRPKPLYTEAALLTAMEESGLGTPATRAGMIEALLKREYIERSGKSLIPTRQGLALYEAVRNLRISDVELTGSWERSLAAIERGEMSPETFMQAITIFTRQITGEVLSLDLKQPPADPIPCPKCRQGNMVIRHRVAKCDNAKCGLVVYRRFLNKELTEKHMQQLLRSGKTRLIKGFEGKAGKTFDARLAFDKHFNLTFRFPEKKNAAGGQEKTKSKPKPKEGGKKNSPVIPIRGQR